MKYSITSQKKKWLVKYAVTIRECLHEIKKTTYNMVDHPSKLCVTPPPSIKDVCLDTKRYKKCHLDT